MYVRRHLSVWAGERHGREHHSQSGATARSDGYILNLPKHSTRFHKRSQMLVLALIAAVKHWMQNKVLHTTEAAMLKASL